MPDEISFLSYQPIAIWSTALYPLLHRPLSIYFYLRIYLKWTVHSYLKASNVMKSLAASLAEGESFGRFFINQEPHALRDGPGEGTAFHLTLRDLFWGVNKI